MRRSLAGLDGVPVQVGLILSGSAIGELEKEIESEGAGVGLGKMWSHLASDTMGAPPFGRPCTLKIAIASRIRR